MSFQLIALPAAMFVGMRRSCRCLRLTGPAKTLGEQRLDRL
jgi:hypothetical protein